MGRPALAGRLRLGDHRWVASDAVLEMLDRADTAARLPRLGGMARADGVVIVSERFWAFAGSDGSLREGAMPVLSRPWRRVPLVRGLVRLAASLSPLFRRTGVARRRERLFLAVAVLAPVGLVWAPGAVGVVVGVTTTAALLCWLLRGRTLFLHGAEHRAIAAAEERRLRGTWLGHAAPSRFSARCGTNFSALLMPVATLGQRFWPLETAAFTPLVVAVLSLAVTMELWQLVQASSSRAARVLLVPGLLLQRVTTREPRLDETRIALRAVASVLRRELD
jgi:uncharacterized protein YqhQ